VRGALGRLQHEAAQVYPIYSNLRLIRSIDYQPIIAGILLFQYNRLVSIITDGIQQMNLQGKQVLCCINVGTVAKHKPARLRPDVSAFVSNL
jgi:hypothetical protein